MPSGTIGLLSGNSGKELPLKNIIIRLLAEEWPLTAKKLFKKAKLEFGKIVSYQAVHKTLQELVSLKVVACKCKEYSLEPFWLQEIEAFAGLALEKYAEKQPFKISKAKSQQCRLRVYDNPDMFYKLMVPLLKKENKFRFSSKSPSLVISSEEKQTPARQQYVEELKKAIEKDAKIKYLISYDATREAVIKNRDRAALENLKTFSNLNNLKIKCAPTKAVMSYAVTKRDLFINPTSITHFAPVAVLHFKGMDFSAVQKAFDIIFAEADETGNLIKEIETAFSRKKKRRKSNG